MSVIRWVRRKLRLSDNTALNAAIREGGGVVIAQPYCRVPIPVRQGRRYDTICGYVHRYTPQLARQPLRCLCAPWTMPAEVQCRSGCIIGGGYPMPIVDHDVQKDKIVRRFKGGRP
jgi:deoxyribodipyrimidine photo-lyase